MKNLKFAAGLLIALAGVVAVAFCGASIGGDGRYDRAIMAYWMQGVGSIAAIFGALLIASSQRADAERLRLQEELADRAKLFDERLALFDLVLLLGEEAVGAIEKLHAQTAEKKLTYSSRGTVGFTFREIEILASQMARIPLEALGSPVAAKDILETTRFLRMILLHEPITDGTDLTGANYVAAKVHVVNRIQNIRLIRTEVDGLRELARATCSRR